MKNKDKFINPDNFNIFCLFNKHFIRIVSRNYFLEVQINRTKINKSVLCATFRFLNAGKQFKTALKLFTASEKNRSVAFLECEQISSTNQFKSGFGTLPVQSIDGRWQFDTAIIFLWLYITTRMFNVNRTNRFKIQNRTNSAWQTDRYLD